MDSTGKALVRTRQPVGFALGYRIARLDLDANHFRDGGQREQKYDYGRDGGGYGAATPGGLPGN